MSGSLGKIRYANQDRARARARARLACRALVLALVLAAFAPVSAQAAFGIASFDGEVSNQDGSPAVQAGSHPYQASTTIEFNTRTDAGGVTIPDGSVKDIQAELPAGFIGNARATPQCSQETLNFKFFCPPSTQIGVTVLELANATEVVGLYNMVTPPNAPALFGFNFAGQSVYASAAVRTGGDYGVDVNFHGVSQTFGLKGSKLTFWGQPADPIHDAQRCGLLTAATSPPSCPGPSGEPATGPNPSSATPAPFLTNPTSCVGPVTTTLHVDSWLDPAEVLSASFVTHDNNVPPTPVGAEGCDRVPFSPSLTVRSTSSSADSPTGLAVQIHLPQNENPVGLAEADLRKATVSLPAGLVVNPSSANGLGSCSAGQIGLDNGSPAACPDASKLGSVEVRTPLLEEPLTGSVFLAEQGKNKFGSLLAVYLVAEGHGVVIKLPGRIETGPGGQVTATFDENPQLPFEDLDVEFFGGPRAALVTPPTCGTYSTTAQFTPWSGTPPVTSTSSFQITSGPNGSPCPNGGFAPKLEAGTTNPVAGSYSPFALNLSREDGTQQLSTIAATLPEGLLGKLAGIPYCSDSALAGIPSAEGTGAAQLANPSCSSASQLGTVSVGTGAGPSPFYVNTGRVYLAGPYKGAPLSLAIVTPALAGPFDLGNVVVRAALQVNPETTRITAVSDPLPTILQGIPLDLRSVAVDINRDGFTLNPTDCEPMAVSSTIGGTVGAVAHPSSRFQVAGCEGLGFSPKLALNLKGGTARAKDPALKAVLTAPAGQANIGRVQVILPRSVFIDQSHVGNPCTRVQFAEGAGNGSACPPRSILGRATAYSPLLAEPLTGNVYFRSNGGERKLPDLVASLNGQIHVNLVGFIDSVHQKGREGSRVRNTFASVPDAPVSRFVLELQGGGKGLLQNSTDLCRSTNKATVRMDGQNGKAHDFETVVRPACGGKPTKKPKRS